MNRNLPLHCPSCSESLIVKGLQCSHCETQVNGHFDLPILARLPAEDQKFITEFVKKSGSLKEMAKTLNFSYPTVRNMLDDLIVRINNIENSMSIDNKPKNPSK